MNEKEIEIYHTILTNIDAQLSSSKNLKETIDCIKKIKTDLKDKQIPKECRDFITNIIKDSQKHTQHLDISNHIITGIRNERKKYDQDYFDNIFNGDQNSLNENLEQVKSFFETIQDDDPNYYSEAINKILKSFKNIPVVLNLKHTYGKQYKANKQQNEYIQKAHEALNEILQKSNDQELELTKVQSNKKEYCLRHMDRMLFNGFISANKSVPYNIDGDLSASEAINLLSNTERFKNNNNAKAIIEILKNTLQEDSIKTKDKNKRIKTYPELIRRVCYKYKVFTDSDKKLEELKIYFTHPINKKPDIHYQKNKKLRNYMNNRKLVECFNLKKIDFEPGYRDKYLEQIEKTPAYVKAICNSTERHLLTFCENNNINTDIIYAGFSALKHRINYETNEAEPIPSSHIEIYKWLKKLNKCCSNDTSKKLLSIELHHDKERIEFSNNPNQNISNFIFTLSISKDILLELTKNIKELYGKNINEAKYQETIQQIESLDKNLKIPDIHSQIYHACDLEIICKEKNKEQSYNYFITPKTNGKHILPP